MTAIWRATLPGQREILAPRAVAAAGLAGPAVVVVGEAVRLGSVEPYPEHARRAA